MRHSNQKFLKNGTFLLFSASSFSNLKNKIRKVQKVKEKWLFAPFLLIFCYNLAKNLLPNTIFVKNVKNFHLLTHQMSKKKFQRKEGLSNLIQASTINKTCWFLAQLQHLEIKISFRGWIFEILKYQDFATFLAKKWPNLKKINFLKFLGPKLQKWKRKLKFWLLQVFCIISN